MAIGNGSITPLLMLISTTARAGMVQTRLAAIIHAKAEKTVRIFVLMMPIFMSSGTSLSLQ